MRSVERGLYICMEAGFIGRRFVHYTVPSQGLNSLLPPSINGHRERKIIRIKGRLSFVEWLQFFGYKTCLAMLYSIARRHFEDVLATNAFSLLSLSFPFLHLRYAHILHTCYYSSDFANSYVPNPLLLRQLWI